MVFKNKFMIILSCALIPIGVAAYGFLIWQFWSERLVVIILIIMAALAVVAMGFTITRFPAVMINEQGIYLIRGKRVENGLDWDKIQRIIFSGKGGGTVGTFLVESVEDGKGFSLPTGVIKYQQLEQALAKYSKLKIERQ